MKLDLYQDVILTVDLAEHGLRAGDVGTLVERNAITRAISPRHTAKTYSLSSKP